MRKLLLASLVGALGSLSALTSPAEAGLTPEPTQGRWIGLEGSAWAGRAWMAEPDIGLDAPGREEIWLVAKEGGGRGNGNEGGGNGGRGGGNGGGGKGNEGGGNGNEGGGKGGGGSNGNEGGENSDDDGPGGQGDTAGESQADSTGGEAPSPTDSRSDGTSRSDVDRSDPESLERAAQGRIYEPAMPRGHAGSGDSSSGDHTPGVIPWHVLTSDLSPQREDWIWTDAPIEGEPEAPRLLRQLSPAEESALRRNGWR